MKIQFLTDLLSSCIWLRQGIRTERNTFLLQERKHTIKHIKIQFNAPACYCAGSSFINLRGWFPPQGKVEAFLSSFFFSNFPSWNNPIGALDTYQIYAVGHISGPRTCGDKEAYHIPHLLCPFRSTPFYGHLYYRVESCWIYTLTRFKEWHNLKNNYPKQRLTFYDGQERVLGSCS